MGIRSLWIWFKCRFVPKHRYHVLTLHKPGYSDPRHQLVLASMLIFERYLGELKHSAGSANHEDAIESLIDEYMKHGDMQHAEHLEEVLDLWLWWKRAKGCAAIDTDFNSKPSFADATEVDKRLRQLLSIRRGMWT